MFNLHPAIPDTQAMLDRLSEELLELVLQFLNASLTPLMARLSRCSRCLCQRIREARLCCTVVQCFPTEGAKFTISDVLRNFTLARITDLRLGFIPMFKELSFQGQVKPWRLQTVCSPPDGAKWLDYSAVRRFQGPYSPGSLRQMKACQYIHLTGGLTEVTLSDIAEGMPEVRRVSAAFCSLPVGKRVTRVTFLKLIGNCKHLRWLGSLHADQMEDVCRWSAELNLGSQYKFKFVEDCVELQGEMPELPAHEVEITMHNVHLQTSLDNDLE